MKAVYLVTPAVFAFFAAVFFASAHYYKQHSKPIDGEQQATVIHLDGTSDTITVDAGYDGVVYYCMEMKTQEFPAVLACFSRGSEGNVLDVIPFSPEHSNVD